MGCCKDCKWTERDWYHSYDGDFYPGEVVKKDDSEISCLNEVFATLVPNHISGDKYIYSKCIAHNIKGDCPQWYSHKKHIEEKFAKAREEREKREKEREERNKDLDERLRKCQPWWKRMFK